MGQVNLPHTSRSDSDPNLFSDVVDNDNAILAELNGGIDEDNISPTASISSTLIDFSTVGTGGVFDSGSAIVGTEQSTSSTSYTSLTTPDTTTVILSTNGLIHVLYQAQWKESVNNAARAAIFLGATQLYSQGATGGSPAVAETGCGGDANVYAALVSAPGLGLLSAATAGVAVGDPVTTGQVVGTGTSGGGLCSIFAAAGTYDLAVKFKASTGTVSAKNRKLWVWSQDFG